MPKKHKSAPRSPKLLIILVALLCLAIALLITVNQL